MKDMSVLVMALAFTAVAALSILNVRRRASIAIHLGAAAVVFVSFFVRIELPISDGLGDVLDLVAMAILLIATIWALLGSRRRPEDAGGSS